VASVVDHLVAAAPVAIGNDIVLCINAQSALENQLLVDGFILKL
jgi:hypothetical protein